MKSLSLPPQLESHPEHAAGIVTSAQLNELLAAGHIDWVAAVALCPTSAIEFLKAPAFMHEANQQHSSEA